MTEIDYDVNSGDNFKQPKHTPQVEEAMTQLQEAAAGLLQVVGDLAERLQPILPEMLTNKIVKTHMDEPDLGLVPFATDLHLIKRNVRTATGTVQDIIDKCEL